jgi:hypothetical protein
MEKPGPTLTPEQQREVTVKLEAGVPVGILAAYYSVPKYVIEKIRSRMQAAHAGILRRE